MGSQPEQASRRLACPKGTLLGVAPVPWVTLAPEQTERLAGVLLCRTHPNALRLRPSRGDGGIDIFDPADGEHVDVYQVKSFATSLTSSRKQQIKKSLARVFLNSSVLVRRWYLVVPLNPTPEEYAWFEELTSAFGFHCYWYGLDRLESLAAGHPDVIEYYLGDGRVRLESAISQLRDLAGLTQRPTGELLTPAEITSPLESVYAALNRDDPHFRYEFQVTETIPPVAHMLDHPWLVASHSNLHDGVCVTHHIFARYLMATEDAPIALTFNVQSGRFDAATAEAWGRALQYGTDVQLPSGTVTDLHIEMPGGLGGTFSEAALWMSGSPASNAQPYRLKLRLIDTTGAVVAEAIVEMESVTRGRRGLRAHGKERGGAFDLEILTEVDDAGNPRACEFSVAVNDLVGLQPAAVRSGVVFLGAVHAPNRLQFGPEFGPLADQTFELPFDDSSVTGILVKLIDCLAELQEKVSADLRISDLDELPALTLNEILRAARLVRGETIRDEWHEQLFKMASLVEPPPEVPSQLAVSGTYQFEIAGQPIALTPITMVLLAADISIVEEAGKVRLLARPALGNNTRLTRLAPIDGVPPQAHGSTAHSSERPERNPTEGGMREMRK